MSNSETDEEYQARILAERRADGSSAIRNEDPDRQNGRHSGSTGNFDWSTDTATSQSAEQVDDYPQPYYVRKRNLSFLERKREQGGLIGAIAGVLLLLAKIAGPVLGVLAKFKFLLIGLKLLVTFGSMLLSMWVYAKLFGWPFGIGIVILIFVHECGHALAAHIRGIPTTGMVFIPFMGAAVVTRGGRSVVEDAFIGIMGPVVGALAGVGCVALSFATGKPIWLALAEWDFMINLFNLIPTAPLDGGWIAPVFSPKALAFGAVLLIAVGFLNPFIWILGLLSLPRIIGAWKADPKTQPFYQVTAADRWKFGLAYFGLAAFLGLAYVYLSRVLGVDFAAYRMR